MEDDADRTLRPQQGQSPMPRRRRGKDYGARGAGANEDPIPLQAISYVE